MLRILLVVLSLACSQAKAQVNDVDLDRLVQAICQVETGGEADPANAVGDNGKAIGPYQILKRTGSMRPSTINQSAARMPIARIRPTPRKW